MRPRGEQTRIIPHSGTTCGRSLLRSRPVPPLLYLIAFGLFRLFDVSKLYPVNRLQDLPGGWGIMLDDIGAGIYTLLIMQIIIYFW